MKGFLAFLTGCSIVATLTLIEPEHARWVALAILAVLFVASAVPRRRVPSATKGTGS